MIQIEQARMASVSGVVQCPQDDAMTIYASMPRTLSGTPAIVPSFRPGPSSPLLFFFPILSQAFSFSLFPGPNIY